LDKDQWLAFNMDISFENWLKGNLSQTIHWVIPRDEPLSILSQGDKIQTQVQENPPSSEDLLRKFRNYDI